MGATGFVAVHVGAGYHAPNKEGAYINAMKAAVKAAQQQLAQHAAALDAVAAAIAVLEGCGVANAGCGSNLNRQGAVECDASVMSGSGSFGAVGAAPGLQHPIQAAARLAHLSQQPLPLGLVPPRLLVGEGARQWAALQGLSTVDPQSQVSAESHQAWQRYSALLAAAEGQQQPTAEELQQQDQQQQEQVHRQAPGSDAVATASGTCHDMPDPKRQRMADHASATAATPWSPQQPNPAAAAAAAHPAAPSPTDAPAGALSGELLLDTVGCVVVDSWGKVAAGVSSGGLAMKYPGRVGEAALFGAGCWAQDAQLQPGAAAAPAAGGAAEICVPLHSLPSASPGAAVAASAGADGRAAGVCQGGQPGVAVSVSGVGEHIMLTQLAQRCAAAAAATAAAGGGSGDGGGCDGSEDSGLAEQWRSLVQRLILAGPMPHDCGVLGVRVTAEELQAGRVVVELAAVHSAASFGVAYAGPSLGPVQCHVLRQVPSEDGCGREGLQHLEVMCNWAVPWRQTGQT